MGKVQSVLADAESSGKAAQEYKDLSAEIYAKYTAEKGALTRESIVDFAIHAGIEQTTADSSAVALLKLCAIEKEGVISQEAFQRFLDARIIRAADGVVSDADVARLKKAFDFNGLPVHMALLRQTSVEYRQKHSACHICNKKSRAHLLYNLHGAIQTKPFEEEVNDDVKVLNAAEEDELPSAPRLERQTSEEYVKSLETSMCSHAFCPQCIQAHIITQIEENGTPTCPVCSARITMNDLTTLLPEKQLITCIKKQHHDISAFLNTAEKCVCGKCKTPVTFPARSLELATILDGIAKSLKANVNSALTHVSFGTPTVSLMGLERKVKWVRDVPNDDGKTMSTFYGAVQATTETNFNLASIKRAEEEAERKEKAAAEAAKEAAAANKTASDGKKTVVEEEPLGKDQWACPTCTYRNHVEIPNCEMCATAMPATKDSVFWICKQCTLRNNKDQYNCGACGGDIPPEFRPKTLVRKNVKNKPPAELPKPCPPLMTSSLQIPSDSNGLFYPSYGLRWRMTCTLQGHGEMKRGRQAESLPNGFTALLWVKPRPNQSSILLSTVANKYSKQGFTLGITDQGNVYAVFVTGGNNHYSYGRYNNVTPKTLRLESKDPLKAGTWSHIGASYDGEFVHLFVNGAEVKNDWFGTGGKRLAWTFLGIGGADRNRQAASGDNLFDDGESDYYDEDEEDDYYTSDDTDYTSSDDTDMEENDISANKSVEKSNNKKNASPNGFTGTLCQILITRRQLFLDEVLAHMMHGGLQLDQNEVVADWKLDMAMSDDFDNNSLKSITRTSLMKIAANSLSVQCGTSDCQKVCVACGQKEHRSDVKNACAGCNLLLILVVLSAMDDVVDMKSAALAPTAPTKKVGNTRYDEGGYDDPSKKKSGVGYGGDDSHDSVGRLQLARLALVEGAKMSLYERLIRCLIECIKESNLVNKAPHEFYAILFASTLNKRLVSIFSSNTLMDLAKDVRLYMSVLDLVNVMASNSLLLPLLRPDGSSLDAKEGLSPQGSVYIHLQKLVKPAKTMLMPVADADEKANVAKEKEEEDTIVTLAERLVHVYQSLNAQAKTSARVRRKVTELFQRSVNEDDEQPSLSSSEKKKEPEGKTENKAKDVETEAIAEYLDALKFGTADLLSSKAPIVHVFKKEEKAVSTNKNRMMRIRQEMASLSSSLPPGIFVRFDSQRFDFARVLIVGADGTPYEKGCFFFDLYLPPSYPQKPPLCKIITTGKASFRFNANLYTNGKVCLSLLGTWSGPKWDPNVSTLLQLFISIQALIMCPEPIVNEPSWGYLAGTTKSLILDQRIHHAKMIFAMRWHLENPPYAFEDVTACHFWLERQAILDKIPEWRKPVEKIDNPNKKNNRRGDDSSIYGNETVISIETLDVSSDKLTKALQELKIPEIEADSDSDSDSDSD